MAGTERVQINENAQTGGSDVQIDGQGRQNCRAALLRREPIQKVVVPGLDFRLAPK
jgi:hypothetical protein